MSALSNAYALLIGVGNDLPVTVRDANAIRNILVDERLAGYNQNNIYLLCEKEATRENILAAFDSIINSADEDSSVVIFYSGHEGTYQDNDILHDDEKKPETENHRHYYIQPNDFDVENFDETWITANELKQKIKAIKSRRLVFFLDCCHAAGMIKSGGLKIAHHAKSLQEPEALAYEIDSGQGISIVSSCRENQQSYILEGDSNSLFTKCLIEVLRAKHKSHFEEPYIRITEVTQYLFRRVPQLIENQKPFVNLQIYDDFVISKVPDYVSITEIQNHQNEEPNIQRKNNEVKTVFRSSENANNLLLFVHGFEGEAEDSFGEIPDLIINDNQFDGWDLFPIGLTKNVCPNMGKQVWASQHDLEMMADFLKTSIQTKFRKYNRIAIVSHGLGGIVTQLALLSLKQDSIKKISHVFLFCAPNNGLTTETIEKLNQNAIEYLSENSGFIKYLRQSWEEELKGNSFFKLFVVAATDDEYVSIDSNFSPFDKKDQIIIRGNHFSSVKANSVNEDSYVVIRENLLNHKILHQFTSAEEANLILGNYKEVVNSLLPQLNELDLKGVKSLCFALEGLDRHSEAMQILENHNTIKENGELMSLLAGRFKRLYLKDFKEKSAAKALELYKSGLEIAQEKNAVRKVYFNAINLAFLSIVYQNDIEQMNAYNSIVKENIEKDVFPSLWKLATEAESALYDADFNRAMDLYAKAREMAGVRERLSIYTNAYTAYAHLMNTKNPNDSFITFLTKTFL